MRVKHLWDVIPLPSNLKLAYSRVTLNLPTTIFFVLTLLQCLVQTSLHIWAYTHHLSVSRDLQTISLSSMITEPLAIRSGEDLLLCKELPTLVGGPDACSKVDIQSRNATSAKLTAVPHFDEDGNLTDVDIVGSSAQANAITVSAQCIRVFPWVFQSLRTANREELTFIFYQIWLFTVSLTAILNESIPHLIAALASGALSIGGAGFRLTETSDFQQGFDRIVTKGSCDGVDLLPGYFQPRRIVEIVMCALNAVIFMACIGLSWRLIRTYGKHSFERVQGRTDMSRLYVVTLSIRSCIQLAMFFMVATIGLFLDQLTLGPLGKVAVHKALYLTTDICVLVLIVPWLIVGWTSARQESKVRLAIFLLITVVFMGAWAAMFASQVYRFLFMTWSFFGMTSIAAMVLMFAAFLFGIYLWIRFDLGLAEYMKPSEPSHPADKVRWSLAVTPDEEKGGLSFSGDRGSSPQVLWYHPHSPATPYTAKRSHSTSSTSTKSSGLSTKVSHHRTNSVGSKRLVKPRSRSGSSAADPYAPPPPGSMPVPIGLKVVPIISVPIPPHPVASITPTQRIVDLTEISPPPRALVRSPSTPVTDLRGLSPPPLSAQLLRHPETIMIPPLKHGSPVEVTTPATITAVDAAIRHSIADSIVSERPSLDVPPPTRRTIRRPPPLQGLGGLPSSVRPNRF